MPGTEVNQPEKQYLNGLCEPESAVPGHGFAQHEVVKNCGGNAGLKQNCDFEIINAFSPELKEKMKKLVEKGIDINELLLKYLEDREQKIQEEKEEIAAEQKQQRAEKTVIGMPTSRHIPAKIIRLIREEHGSVCAHNGCEKYSKHIHHEHAFATFQVHDPRYLKPLCKGHHELAHVGDQKVQKYRYYSKK